MINMIYDEMSTSQQGKKLKIKLAKKAGMKDSQVIQNLAESITIRQSQYLENIKESQSVIWEQSIDQRLNQIGHSRPFCIDDFHSYQTGVEQYSYRESHHERNPSIGRRQSVTQSQYFDSNRMTFGINDKLSTHKQEAGETLFMLPKQVQKFIETFPDYQKILSDHISNQKLKIERDFNSFKDEILLILAQKKQQIIGVLDETFERFEGNYKELLKKVQEFKGVFTQQQATLSNSIPITVQSLSYYYQQDKDTFTKIKEEKCVIKQKLSNIDGELLKRSMIFMVDDLEKQIFTKVAYNASETQHLLYQEIKMNINQIFVEQLCNMSHLLTMNPQYDYESLILLPKVETFISENHQNAMGGDRDLQELEALKVLISQKLTQQKTRMNVSLGLGQGMKNLGLKLQMKFQSSSHAPLYSLLAISDDLMACGGRDGIVQIWSISLNKQMSSLQTRQPVTCMRIFKGILGDFNVTLRANLLNGRVDSKEEQYLVTANADIKIWDMKNLCMLKSFKGHNGTVTSILALRDMHTLVSGGEDGQTIFWNAYSGMAMKRMKSHQATIHSIVLSKEGRLISCSSDRTIQIFSLHYVKSQIYGRQVFGDCIRDKVIEDVCQIYSIQCSLINENLLISGGSDAKIKIWNTKSGQIDREIVGHKCPIGDLVLLENPLDVDEQKMFVIISMSTGDDVLRVSTSISPLNSGIYIEEKILNEFAATCNPLLQLVQDPIEKSLRLLVVNQDEKSQSILMLKLQ